MTQETETNINEAIDWLQQTGGSIQSFALEQAPIYCREVVAWEFWSGTIYAVVGAVMTAVGVIAARKFIQWMHQDDGEPNGRTLSAFTVAIVGLSAGVIMVLENTPRAIKAAVSPRLVIVEHLAGLRK